jgi:X-X-X-Leu-X-X-Gly heptad repeat protein
MQHYRMTLSEAIEHYRKGWITATALLYYYLKIRLKRGWKVTLHQREIKKRLGIPKSSFYRAIENLSKERLINWETPNGLVVELVGDNEIDEDKEIPPPHDYQQDKPIESHRWDSSLTDGTESLTNGTGSLTDGTKTPDKPSPSINSSDSSNFYQFFINSLSESERENFLIFVKKQINDIEAWLASINKAGQNRWEIYYQKFQASSITNSKDSQKCPVENHIQQQARKFREELEERKRAAREIWEKDKEAVPETTCVSEETTPKADAPDGEQINLDDVFADYERNKRGQLPEPPQNPRFPHQK